MKPWETKVIHNTRSGRIYITGWSITQVKWSAHIRVNLVRQVVFINLISWTKRFINIFSIKLLKAFKNTSINWCFLNVTGIEATLYVETGQSSAVYVFKAMKAIFTIHYNIFLILNTLATLANIIWMKHCG